MPKTRRSRRSRKVTTHAPLYTLPPKRKEPITGTLVLSARKVILPGGKDSLVHLIEQGTVCILQFKMKNGGYQVTAIGELVATGEKKKVSFYVLEGEYEGLSLSA